jgi:flagellar M-ring protein FliF
MDRARQTFSGFTTGQRTVTALLVGLLLVGGIFFTRWAARPSYAPLFSNLSASDASAITTKLDGKKVSYQLADGGSTVRVPSKDVYQLRLDMSADNLPSGGASGYALLDKQGITTSDFQQHVQYQRALEGEITKTILAINGVTSAVVHLAIPEQSVFATETQKPTASVLVATVPGQPMTSDQVQAVVHLVSSSVAGLDPADVTVADADGHVLNAPGVDGGSALGDDTRTQQTQAFQDRVAQQLQTMLDQVVGTGHSIVRVSADLDYDQTQRTSKTYVQPARNAVPLAVSSTTENYSGAGTPTGGVLGPDNTGVTTGAGGTNNSYRHDQVTQENAVGEVTEDVQTAPGSVKRMSVAVLLDEHTGGAIDPVAIQKMVTNAAGLVSSRGDSVSVTALPFDQTAAKAAASELKAAAAAKSHAALLNLAKTGGLLAILLGVVIVLLRRGRRTTSVAVPISQLRELEEMRRQLARESAVEAAAPTAALPPGPNDADLKRIAVQEEIGAMVERQPDEVAQLLRGWLADRRS